MYIQTQTQYTVFESDELTELLGKIDFQIHNFGVWRSEHDTRASYISNDIEIVFYKEGGSTTIIGNKKYDCSPGSCLILEPFQLNTSINENYPHYEYYYFHFDVEPLYLKQQFMSLLIRHGHLIHKEEMRNFNEMLNRLLVEVEEKEIGYSSIVTSALMRICVEIMRAQLKRGKDNCIGIVHSQHTELVNDAIKYIQNHLYEPIRLEALSQDLGVSKSILYKSFIHVLSMSPSQYIHHQKIQYAQKRLLLGESVTHIAQDLGYSSAYHLSKAFKQEVGMSPREYKNHMKTL